MKDVKTPKYGWRILIETTTEYWEIGTFFSDDLPDTKDIRIAMTEAMVRGNTEDYPRENVLRFTVIASDGEIAFYGDPDLDDVWPTKWDFKLYKNYEHCYGNKTAWKNCCYKCNHKDTK